MIQKSLNFFAVRCFRDFCVKSDAKIGGNNAKTEHIFEKLLANETVRTPNGIWSYEGFPGGIHNYYCSC